MKLEILCIEDHSAIVEGYKSILSFNTKNLDLKYTSVIDCESAYNLIKEKNCNYDVIFLDLALPSFLEKNIRSGDDLVIFIKKYLPQSKIVIITSHTESILLYSIIKKVQPAGFLIKSDFSAEEFIVAFESIISGEIVYSSTVKESLLKIRKREYYLDEYNRQILILLNQGIKTKSLPFHLNISLSAIDKRKSQLKVFFGIQKGGDDEILREARNAGFI